MPYSMYIPVTDWKDDVIFNKEVNPPRPRLDSAMKLHGSTAAVKFNKS